MIEKLKKQLDIKGYIYTNMGDSILVEFTKFSVVYRIFDDKYTAYIFNNKNEIIAHKEFKQVKRAIDYTFKFY